jgi:hypothetical protein
VAPLKGVGIVEWRARNGARGGGPLLAQFAHTRESRHAVDLVLNMLESRFEGFPRSFHIALISDQTHLSSNPRCRWTTRMSKHMAREREIERGDLAGGRVEERGAG